MNSKWLLIGCALASACAFAQSSPPKAGKGASGATPAPAGKVLQEGARLLKTGVAPVIPETAAKNPNAPPAHVLERLRAVGASPVAISVHEQLADKPLSAQ